MNAPSNGFHPSWLQSGELLATDMALGSVNRVLASLDRIEAHDARIERSLADYRSIVERKS